MECGAHIAAARNGFQELLWIRSSQIEMHCAAHPGERHSAGAGMTHENSDGIGECKFIRG